MSLLVEFCIFVQAVNESHDIAVNMALIDGSELVN